MRRWSILSILLAAAAAVIALAPTGTSANTLYPADVLTRDAPRLKRAIKRIYERGIKPVLKPVEAAGLAGVRFAFPMPKPDDPFLNFYAGQKNGQAAVVLPLQSLKLVEDLATAFAWLYESKKGFGGLDLYFAMLQRKPLSLIGPAGRRDILRAIGAPANVLSDKRVDRLGLSLRNEAFAFVLTHELGHLLYKHKGLAQITPAEARADEVQSDTFALNVLARSRTPPLGAVLFFQAQIFSLPHRGEHKTPEEWQTYLETASTHPLSVDRIRAMAAMVSGPLAGRRPAERAIWRDIGAKLRSLSDVLADVELHNCMTRVASEAPVSLLRQTASVEANAIKQYCKSR